MYKKYIIVHYYQIIFMIFAFNFKMYLALFRIISKY